MNTASAPSIQIDAWTKLKMSLGEDIDWIKYFVDPIEQRVSEIVSTTPSPPVFYEPMLIELGLTQVELS